MFQPHLLYCSIILSCTSSTALSKISQLQKKSIRIINKSKPSAHTTPLFLDSHILPFEKLVMLNKLLFMHSIAFNYALFHLLILGKNDSREIEYQLRNQDLCVIPPFRIEQFHKIPLFSLPHSWNKLPNSLKYQHN
jgi:hypothetical protein